LHGVLSLANARLVIGDADCDGGALRVLVPDESSVSTSAATDPMYQPQALEVAHIGFTSGSTGQPKGVLTPHGALAARTAWVATQWPSGAGRARLAKSAPTAIDATAELCEAFVTGDCLVMATDSQARDAVALADLLKAHTIGHVMAVPGLIEAMALAAPQVIGGRNRVLSTGEPLLPSLACAVYQAAPAVPLYNAYGCTETAGDMVSGPVSHAEANNGQAPIGGPLPGSRCYVLAADLTLTPPGGLGELYVEGPQLALGYLAQPALTAARFVANPFGDGGRLYRTGDLARWRGDGRLDLAGRSDDQVNVRGHRVEPAETVAALLALPMVREAAVLPRRLGSTNELVAYVVGEDLTPDEGPRLRARLAQTLPGPLVPAEVVVLPRLPRLGGGKIDRQALPHTAPSPRLPSKAPENEQQALLARLLGDVLGREPVGVDDDFFALGGDSLLALSFAARATAAGLPFPAAAVFQYPTAAALAQQFAPAKLPPAKVTRATPVPLAAAVHRFRLSGVAVEEFLTWEVLKGPCDAERLHQALDDTLARHATLQHAVTTRGRLWRASLFPATDPQATKATNRVIETNASTAAEALAQARSALDLSAGQGILALVCPEATLLVAHPVVVDGLSLAKIAEDIDTRLAGGVFPPSHPLSADSDGVDLAPADWAAILTAGLTSRWWIGAQEPTPSGQQWRVRFSTGPASASQLTRTFLHAAHALSGQAVLVADVESMPDALGPLMAVPVMVRADSAPVMGTAASYSAFAANHRPTAGGPGILLRRSVAPQLWPAEGPARGADRLYHCVAGWQDQGAQIVLEVAAADASLADAMARAWHAALSDQALGSRQ
jgi:amino acid adenylation domain-containing protein